MDTVASEPAGPDADLPAFKDRYARLCILGVFAAVGQR